MKIVHIALWAEDIELLRKFYMRYFNMHSNDKYVNTKRNFSSYFLSFEDGGSRIEIMNIPGKDAPASRGDLKGLALFSSRTIPVPQATATMNVPLPILKAIMLK